jgi:putative N6-adenine-specific DNA methylase
LSLLGKDAICDQFRERTTRRPNVRLEKPDLRVHLHFFQDKFTVCLDASDEPLHMRGWHREAVAAPLNEVLAAGLLKLADWTPERPIVDPMCGSGTLLIEAAMVATNTPAQFYRTHFGILTWKNFNERTWREVVNEAKKRMISAKIPLFGFDKDPQARNISRVNALSAEEITTVVNFEKVEFEKLSPDFFSEKINPTLPRPGSKNNGFYDLTAPSEPLFLEKIGQKSPEKPPLLIFNPPYDERLKIDDINKFYAMIGERLKHRWSGWEAWIISSNKEALQNIGLRASQKVLLNNGGLDCWFNQYELFEGKKVD